MKRHAPSSFWLVGLALLAATSGAAQSVADVARDSKLKNHQSTRRVWTNDDFSAPAGVASEAAPFSLLGPPQKKSLSLGPFAVTPLPLVRRMLQVAGVQPGELVVDIGSGDGRIVIMAAEEFGARAVGIELNPDLVAESRRAVAARKLEQKVQIIHANALDVDLSAADVVTLYLTPSGLGILAPHLDRTLRLDTRVVCFAFQIPAWTPDAEASAPKEQIWLYRMSRKR